MGQNLCCMRQPSPDDHPKEASAFDSNFSTPVSSISNRHLIFPDEKKLGQREFSTFGECLMDSPKMNIPQCSANIHTSGGDQLQVDQKLYQKIHPASPDVHMDFFTPRISFSSDKLGVLGKVDEEDEEGLCGGSISSRSQSGKLKKRVRFKLPEAADIIIFYPPKETLEGISIP